MADAIKRSVMTRRTEYRLHGPTPYVELDKALRWADEDFRTAFPGKAVFDDSILVECQDDAIVIYFVETIK